VNYVTLSLQECIMKLYDSSINLSRSEKGLERKNHKSVERIIVKIMHSTTANKTKDPSAIYNQTEN